AFGSFAATMGRWIIREPDTEKKDLFGQSLDVIKVAFLNGAAWCGLEWLRGIAFTGFGWNGLGVALKDHLLLVQFADVIGINGYGFVMMFSGIIAFATLVRLGLEVRERKRLRPHLDFALGVGIIIALFLYGIPKVSEAPEESIDLNARIMQLNVDLEDKWSEDIAMRQKIIFDYRDLTRTFVEVAPHDLVLWPETAIPGHFSFPWVQKYFNEQVLQGDDFYLLTGLEDSTLEGDEIYNTITLMKGSTDSYQMYKKIHLVPLGEYIPFRDTFPLFQWIAGGIIETDFVPGSSYETLEIEKDGHAIEIIPLICFEDTVPRHARKFMSESPQLFVNVTNDGWFYDSAQPIQHFYNAIFRCIEFRRPMIRAANTGVSGFVDIRGSIFDRRSRADENPRILQDEETGSTYIRGSLPGRLEIDLNPPLTVYAKIGDAFSITLGTIALIVALFGVSRSLRVFRSESRGK
ncbi:MAG: apolipoprotein N-acyltransferase, partial [Verrucomicrobiota bacterium]